MFTTTLCKAKMAHIARFLLCFLLVVVGILEAAPKQHVFGFGKRAAEALGDPEIDWNAVSKRLNNNKFVMGFGKRALHRQFTMGLGKRAVEDDLQSEEELSNEDVTGSMFTKTLGKRLYGLGKWRQTFGDSISALDDDKILYP
ncbi:hypothetical protein OESDEN_12450 [Oesophagostomum dentatum]|uniref:Uncharacterized protein n=1 Tax=Oesophagostomum dentatum TaxID=61180 RepID=A0A0B1SW69_OESDE|nr:hypothetical protein OESDEN_12450 [Oesophagostomum dentatum]